MGATVGTALFSRRHGAAGVALCAAGALLPDLDAVLTGDRLSYIQFHRSFTHSLCGAAVLAPTLAGAAKLLRMRGSFVRLTVIALVGIMIGIAADLATWWGTQVLWPFSRARVGVGLVFIIDLWLTGIVLFPWLLWGARRLLGYPFPRLAFRASAALLPLYLLLCLGARSWALSAPGAFEAYPQPFSPLRWSVAFDEGNRYRLEFRDLLAGGEPLEVRRFPKGASDLDAAVDASEEGRILNWFHHLPVREVRREDGRTAVIQRDLAYEMFPRIRPGLPFAYRFVVEDGRVVESGFLED